MINLLELFGACLAIIVGYAIAREKNYKLLLLGIILLPFGVMWEGLTAGTVWIYTTPPDVSYSMYITRDLPLIIPLGWSLCMMIFFHVAGWLKEKINVNRYVLLFLIGAAWGLIFEFVFVSLGHWQYLLYPQVANLRPNVPVAWGIITVSLILTFDFLWNRCGNELKKKPYYLLLFGSVYLLVAIILVVIIKFVSFSIMDPLCMATICK